MKCKRRKRQSLDVSAGAGREDVEDCPLCCRLNVIHVDMEADGKARVWSPKRVRALRPRRMFILLHLAFGLDLCLGLLRGRRFVF
ncbi:MAG TPA: CPXCG motif-containing cysteine-rich protein [Pirellulales bacterium]|nr:CPXCG motif-containing cysteine-rich protein [Pirellulales bacterium]